MSARLREGQGRSDGSHVGCKGEGIGELNAVQIMLVEREEGREGLVEGGREVGR